MLMNGFIKHICACGRTMEVKYNSTVVTCSCGRTMDKIVKMNSLKGMRIRAKLTQQQVADKIGVSKSYVSKAENGECEVPEMLKEKLVKLYTRVINLKK